MGKRMVCPDCLDFLQGRKNKDPAGMAEDNDSYPFFRVKIERG